MPTDEDLQTIRGEVTRILRDLHPHTSRISTVWIHLDAKENPHMAPTLVTLKTQASKHSISKVMRSLGWTSQNNGNRKVWERPHGDMGC